MGKERCLLSPTKRPRGDLSAKSSPEIAYGIIKRLFSIEEAEALITSWHRTAHLCSFRNYQSDDENQAQSAEEQHARMFLVSPGTTEY